MNYYYYYIITTNKMKKMTKVYEIVNIEIKLKMKMCAFLTYCCSLFLILKDLLRYNYIYILYKLLCLLFFRTQL